MPRNETYNNPLTFVYGTRSCCSNLSNSGLIMSPCIPCNNCTQLMQCNQIFYGLRPGLPDNQFISTQLIRVVNTTGNCLDECHVNPNCYTYSYSVDYPSSCSLYSGLMGRLVITNNSVEKMTGGKFCCSKLKNI
ncbi:unnamed protein product [Schistosoma turkestanicum]|nr:unnamed protein product [Schistosoma turkestanicum]